MDTEKRKKNKTDKDRLVAGTDGWDAPACGPGEGSPYQRLGQAETLWGRCGPLPAWLPQVLCSGRGGGGVPSSHEDSNQGSPEHKGQSRGGSEMMLGGQPGPLHTQLHSQRPASVSAMGLVPEGRTLHLPHPQLPKQSVAVAMRPVFPPVVFYPRRAGRTSSGPSPHGASQSVPVRAPQSRPGPHLRP